MQWRFVTLILLVVLLCSAAPAQTYTASIRGTVTDATGAVIPNAAITVTNENTGLVRTTMTSGTGNYEVLSLPVGTYSVQAKVTGFTEMRQKGLVLHVNDIAVLNMSLKVGTTSEQVTVEANGLAVET